MAKHLSTVTKAILAGVLLGGTLLMLLPRDLALRLTAEGGWIENLSAITAAGAVILALLRLLRSASAIWLSITLATLWLYLRELDYQKLFTPRSVESIGFYSSSSIPMSTKLLAIVVLAPFGIAMVHLAWLGLRELRTGRALRAAWCPPLAFTAVLLLMALTAEKVLPVFHILEEVFELGFILLVFLAVASTSSRGNPPKPRPGSTALPAAKPPGDVS